MAKAAAVAFESGDPEEIFEIIEPLGEGAYGSVYKARDTRDGEMVALKIMPLEAETGTMEKEVAILKRCSSPFIVNFKGGWKLGDHLWLAMEYCGAGSITDLMKVTKKCLTEKQLRVVVRETLEGLKYLHSQKLIHRDIKAGNVLVNGKGQCKLADFGVSREACTLYKATTVIGTPYWMAPEVFKEESYNELADIWSLGITIIEMATGRPPHHDKPPLNAIFLIPKSEPPTLSVGKWSDVCHDFLRLCVNKDPRKRPSAKELLKHAWIRATPAGLKPIIEMVAKAMPLLDAQRKEARLDEMAEAGDGAAAVGTEESDEDDDDSDDEYQSSTIVQAGDKQLSDSEEDDSGDFNSGTMVIQKKDASGDEDEDDSAEDYSDDGDAAGTMLVRDDVKSDTEDEDSVKRVDDDEDDDEVAGASETHPRVLTKFPETVVVGVDDPFDIPKGLSKKQLNEIWVKLGKQQKEDMAKLDDFYNGILRDVLVARKRAAA